MNMKTSLTPAQQDVYERITALRKLTADTGTRTTKTQNDLLQAQSSEDLAAVALALYGN